MQNTYEKHTKILSHLGVSALMMSIVGISGCWIPLLNLISISASIMGIVLATWNIVEILRTHNKNKRLFILPLSGILVGTGAIITAMCMNYYTFSPHGGIKNFMDQAIAKMVQKDTTENNKSDQDIPVASDNASQESENTKSEYNDENTKLYGIGDATEIEGRKLTITQIQKNFDMSSEYSAPKPGYQFVCIGIKIENVSDADINISQYDIKVKDSQGTLTSPVAATYLLENQLESETIAAGQARSGSVIFEVPDNDENLRLIYQLSWAPDKKVEINLQ